MIFNLGGSTMRADVGIDLGTSSVLVYVKGKGVILEEPAVVSIDRDTNKFLAVGLALESNTSLAYTSTIILKTIPPLLVMILLSFPLV